jgi:hypothetical protein
MGDLADSQATAGGEAEQDEVHMALFRAFGLAYEAGQDEAEFLAREDLRRVDGGGAVGDMARVRGERFVMSYLV